MNQQKSSDKPFDISKQEVWDGWLKVKRNQGAPGVDGQSLEAFEADLKDNLYKIWNRMSSGSYFPPPVKAVARLRDISFAIAIGSCCTACFPTSSHSEHGRSDTPARPVP